MASNIFAQSLAAPAYLDAHTPHSTAVPFTATSMPTEELVAKKDSAHDERREPYAKPIEHLHGTTTLGFVFDKGVLVAVDSRSSMGSIVSSWTVKKVLEISPFLLGTMAGGAADCQFWHRDLSRRVRLFELRNQARVPVAAAARMFSNTMQHFRGYGLSVGTMIAGYDDHGPDLYYVDNDGKYVRGRRFSVGSGSLFAYSILDSGYRADLSVDEAVDLGFRAIYHATHRDAGSGGFINVYYVGPDGWVHYPPRDCYELHHGRPAPCLLEEDE